MTLLTNILITLVCAPCLSAQDLSVQTTAGQCLSRSFRVDQFLSTQDMAISNGSEVSHTTEALEIASHQVFEAVDLIQAVDDTGRVTDARRVFRELAGRAVTVRPGEAQGQSRNDTIEFVGMQEATSVRFLWDANRAEYGKYYDASHADEYLLKGLRLGPELGEFLPAPGSDLTQEWDVPASAIESLVAPFGELLLDPKEVQDPRLMRSLQGGAGLYGHALFGTATGTLKARYLGPLGEAGDPTVSIELVIDVAVQKDRTEQVMATRDFYEREMKYQAVEARSVWSVQLQGRLDWNLLEGRWERVLLDGKQVLDQGVVFEIPADGEDGAARSQGQRLILEGSYKLEATNAPLDASRLPPAWE